MCVLHALCVTQHCTQFNGERSITLAAVEQAWNAFAEGIYTLAERSQVLLLDAPIPVRRSIHLTIHRRYAAVAVTWVVDSAATITNMMEEVGADAMTFRTFLTTTGGSMDVLVVEGIHRFTIRQQTIILQQAVQRGVRTILLAGDSVGKGIQRGRALDGWTLCVHAALQRGITQECDASYIQGLVTSSRQPGWGVCVQPILKTLTRFIDTACPAEHDRCPPALRRASAQNPQRRLRAMRGSHGTGIVATETATMAVCPGAEHTHCGLFRVTLWDRGHPVPGSANT